MCLYRLLSRVFPKGNKCPTSRNDARKYITSIGGLDYNKIHACVNDSLLYRGENETLRECPHCGAPRFRQDVSGLEIPQKVLRHFPIIPRIKLMFTCKNIAPLMSWHRSHRSSDGKWRIPADAPAWKHIESTWPEFEVEPRHLRLGLGMDGVNPFGLRSSTYSVWPILLVNYNLPPHLAIKKGHAMLSLLVPGKHKVKNMDVYLEPLIEELETLWRGVLVQDISRPPISREFVLRGILLWTMHDYLGYGECSGKLTITILLFILQPKKSFQIMYILE